MYNGIGLTTARGSGTNGYVQRNLSTIRKTKEKVQDYAAREEDKAVRPFDPELVEHERRRQTEVRCLELRELLEEQGISESEIDEKVNTFRTKLLNEKKKQFPFQRDSSGRALARDSHELSLAQEQKNDRAKDAFGIRADFIPGASFAEREADKGKEITVMESMKKSLLPSPDVADRREREKDKKRKKSKKRRSRSSSSDSSSSSTSSSSEDERRHKKRHKKSKKSKKSHKKSSKSSRGEKRSRSPDRSSNSNSRRR